MGIPESITHAIEQLPVGESLNSTRYGGNVQRVCKLGDAKVKKGKFCTRAKCGSSDSAQEPSVAHQILHKNQVWLIRFCTRTKCGSSDSAPSCFFSFVFLTLSILSLGFQKCSRTVT